MTALGRLLVIGLAVAATLLATVACAYLSAPLWVDSAAVKNEIARLVERSTGHPVRMDQLQVRLFPPVGVEVSNPRYASDTVSAQVQTAVVDVEFWPLLAGRVRPRLVEISGARVTVALKPGQAGHAASLQDMERRLRDALARLATAAPDLEVAIDDSTVEIQPADATTLVLRNLQARARVSEAGIAGSVECSSGFWQRALVEFALTRDLASRGRAELVGLDAAGLMAWFATPGDWRLAEAEAIGRIDWRMKGLSQVDAEFSASTPRISLQRGDVRQSFSGIAAAGRVGVHGEAWSLELDRLFLREPRLMLSSRIARDARSRYAFRVRGGDMDLTQLLAVARTLAPEAGVLAKPPFALRAGTLASLDLGSVAESLAGLFDVESLQGELALQDIDAIVPSPPLHVTGGAANLSLEHGSIRARDARATLGNSFLRDGELDAEVADEPKLLRAMAVVDLDLAQARDIALGYPMQQEVRAHLAAVEYARGRAVARVDLAEGRHGLRAAVDLSALALTVQHRKVPLPLQLTGGRIRYASGQLTIEQATGAFGRSPFAGLDARLEVRAPYRFELRQREARLALEELYHLLLTMPASSQALAGIQNPSGSVTLAGAQAKGTLDAPARVNFRAVLQPHSTRMLVTRLGTEVVLDGGEAEFTDHAFSLRGVGVEILDARLRVSARAGDYRDGLRTLDGTVEGDIGPAAFERVEQELALPLEARLRPPLRLSGVNAAWKRDGDISVKGRVRVAGQTDVDIDVTRTAHALQVHTLRVQDRASDARFIAELAGDNLNAAFQGKLAGETLVAVFVQPPLAFQAIEGDFAADLHRQRPWITRAQGRLSGSGIVIPLEPQPLTVERAILDATGSSITIEEATVALGEDHAAIKGTVHRDGDKVILDVNVKADRIVLPKLIAQGEDGTGNKLFQLSDLPVAGHLGIDLGRLETEKLTIAPLVADARIEGDTMDLRIERAALCDITMSGTLRGRLRDLRLDGSLASRGADVEKAIACLTGGRVVLSGVMDIDARLTAQGPLGKLGKHFDGNFTASARDGRIERFDTLSRVFAFLNVTEVVRGQKIQLGEKGLSYRTVNARGTLAGETVHLEELVMDATTVHIAAAGSIDYGTGRMGMDVLVAPLQTVNVLLGKIPLVERIFGGSVLALPVRVAGTVNSPVVVPLGPGSVARRMTSIIANTLRLPLDAVKMVTPSSGNPAPP